LRRDRDQGGGGGVNLVADAALGEDARARAVASVRPATPASIRPAAPTLVRPSPVPHGSLRCRQHPGATGGAADQRCRGGGER
jgi:hypothetical protein